MRVVLETYSDGSPKEPKFETCINADQARRIVKIAKGLGNRRDQGAVNLLERNIAIYDALMAAYGQAFQKWINDPNRPRKLVR